MSEMGNQGAIQIIIIVILLLCGYLGILQYVYKHAENQSAFPILAVFLLILYGSISGMLVYVLGSLGNMEIAFMGILMLGACLFMFFSLRGLTLHFREISKSWLAMFLVYVLAVAYVTIFSRHGENDTSILTGFVSIEKAIRTRSTRPLNHMMLNVIMFVPLGYLFPMILPGRLNKILLVTIMGAMMTVTIESVQLLLRLGQCDLEDMLANTLGAVIGLLFFRLYNRFFMRESNEKTI